MLSQPKPAAKQSVLTVANQPDFITSVKEGVQVLADRDAIIRIRSDSTAHTVIAFNGYYRERPSKDIDRRVYVETKRTPDQKYSVIFMTRIFDENAVVIDYDEDTFKFIPQDICRYIRSGVMPDQT